VRFSAYCKWRRERGVSIVKEEEGKEEKGKERIKGEEGKETHEAVSSPVLSGSGRLLHAVDLSLDDRVVETIDHRVDAKAEDVLVVVSLNARTDEGTELVDLLALSSGVGVQDTGEADFEFGGAVLLEDPLEEVFVVGDSTDHLDDELARADGVSLSSGAEVGVL
jgi:hypothetical protein